MENQMKNDDKFDLSAMPDSAAAPSKPLSIDETIEVWFAKNFHNLGALIDERLHNILHAAKEDLKAELAKL
jgi:hypothetical protein